MMKSKQISKIVGSTCFQRLNGVNKYADSMNMIFCCLQNSHTCFQRLSGVNKLLITHMYIFCCLHEK